MARSVVERHSRIPKIRRFDHDDTSEAFGVQHHCPVTQTPWPCLDDVVIFWFRDRAGAIGTHSERRDVETS
jgi:hypothetical protein